MKFCVDYQSEGAIKHMSSQGMLEQLVNSIIEGPFNKSCKTICSRFFFIFRKESFTALNMIEEKQTFESG